MNRIYSIIIALLISVSIYSQEVTDSVSVASSTAKEKKEKREIKYPHLFWGFSAGAGQYGMAFENEALLTNNSVALSGGIFFDLQILKWLSVELGGNYMMFNSDVLLMEYNADIKAVDDEQVEYIHSVRASDIFEQMMVNMLEIPLSVKFIWNPGNWNLYLKPGVAYTMSMSATYEQSSIVGIFGNYEQEGLVFYDVPKHGYFTPKSFSSTGDLVLQKTINPFIGAGIIFPGRRGNFFIEGRYYPGLTDFASKGNGTLFEGPMDNKPIGNNQFESISEEVGKVTLNGFIVQMGFRF